MLVGADPTAGEGADAAAAAGGARFLLDMAIAAMQCSSTQVHDTTRCVR